MYIKDVFYISCSHKIGIEYIYEYLEQYEDKIEQKLCQNGWLIVQPQKLKIIDQASLFNSAKLISGIEGSAFHVMLLAGIREAKITIFSRAKNFFKRNGFNGNFLRIAETLNNNQKLVKSKFDKFENLLLEFVMSHIG